MKLWDAVNYLRSSGFSEEQICEVMNAFADVTKCKDCKWYGGKMNYPHPYKECTRHHCLSAPNDYCSRAERKEK